MFAIKILVETVVIISSILKDYRCGSVMAGLMKSFNLIFVIGRIINLYTQRLVPAIGDRNKKRIDRSSQARNDVGKWIVEIPIFSTTEGMSLHYHSTAEKVVLTVETGDLLAFICRKDTAYLCIALRVELLQDLLPCECPNAFGNTLLLSRG